MTAPNFLALPRYPATLCATFNRHHKTMIETPPAPTELPNLDLQTVVNEIKAAVPNTVIGGSIGPGGMLAPTSPAQRVTPAE